MRTSVRVSSARLRPCRRLGQKYHVGGQPRWSAIPREKQSARCRIVAPAESATFTTLAEAAARAVPMRRRCMSMPGAEASQAAPPPRFARQERREPHAARWKSRHCRGRRAQADGASRQMARMPPPHAARRFSAAGTGGFLANMRSQRRRPGRRASYQDAHGAAASWWKIVLLAGDTGGGHRHDGRHVGRARSLNNEAFTLADIGQHWLEAPAALRKMHGVVSITVERATYAGKSWARRCAVDDHENTAPNSRRAAAHQHDERRGVEALPASMMNDDSTMPPTTRCGHAAAAGPCTRAEVAADAQVGLTGRGSSAQKDKAQRFLAAPPARTCTRREAHEAMMSPPALRASRPISSTPPDFEPAQSDTSVSPYSQSTFERRQPMMGKAGAVAMPSSCACRRTADGEQARSTKPK